MIDFLWLILNFIAWFMTIIGVLIVSVVVLTILSIAGLFGMYELALRGEDNQDGNSRPGSKDKTEAE